MAKTFSLQKTELIPLVGAGPLTLCALPKGYRGYVRVMFYSATASDQMFGMWVPINAENQPQGVARLNAVNFSLLWRVGDEKLWDFPAEAMALVVFVSAANSGYATVDCNGVLEDHR